MNGNPSMRVEWISCQLRYGRSKCKDRIPFVGVAPNKTLHPAIPPFLFYTTYLGGVAALSYNHLIALSSFWG